MNEDQLRELARRLIGYAIDDIDYLTICEAVPTGDDTDISTLDDLLDSAIINITWKD